MVRLSPEFYQSSDVTDVAKELIGKVLVTNIGGKITSAIITETEAYHQKEKACHAYNGRRTLRTDVLFESGGHSYVYLCYGIHYLFNVTVGNANEAAAVLIRATEPLKGIDHMVKRRGHSRLEVRTTAGPGMLTQALGISLRENRKSLSSNNRVWIESYKDYPDSMIETSTRVGVEYAEEDALLPWRFFLKNSKWVSKK